MTKQSKYTKRKGVIKKNIILITALSSLIPLCMTLIVAIFSFRNYIMSSEYDNKQEYINSITYTLNSKIQSYNEALSYLVHNDPLLDAISEVQTSNFEMYNFYRNALSPSFNSVIDQHNDIKSITLYTTKPINNHGNYVIHLSDEEMMTRFNLERYSINKMVSKQENQTISIYSQLVRSDIDTLNVISFTINFEDFFESVQPLRTGTTEITFFDNRQDEIFQTQELSAEVNKNSFLSDIIPKVLLIPDSITQTFSLNNGWTGTILSDITPFYEVTSYLILSSIILLLFIMMITLYLLRYLTHRIAEPIVNLADEMSAVDENNFKLKKQYDNEDEIGILYQSFEEMLLRIKTLIDDVYNTEVMRQKSELRSLQAQINPHFFYNSLSLINNKAILTGNEDISEMALLLSKFYRLSLNSGNDTITIAKELELTTAYATIQQKMHNYSFDVNLEIDESILNYQIINLVLQPFVENAIIHGLAHIEDERQAVLTISAELVQDKVRFCIADNGIGMEQALVKNILSVKSKHYGIKNVDQRLYLYYGIKEAIKVTSKKHVGTSVLIELPINILLGE